MIERPASSFANLSSVVPPRRDERGQVAVIGDRPGALGTTRPRKTEVECKAFLPTAELPIAGRVANASLRSGAAAFGK